MTKLGIVTGLESEARILDRLRGTTADLAIATAPGRAARAAADRLITDGATALLSFGVAGGLDPQLAPGSLVIAVAVHTASHTFATDGRWRSRLAAVLGRSNKVAVGVIAGVDLPVASAVEKGALFAASGAISADMESHHVGEAAAARGLPFLAVRAIADPALRAVPRAALDAIDADGSVRLGILMRSLALRPADILALPSLARDYRAALAALGRAAAEAGPAFAVG